MEITIVRGESRNSGKRAGKGAKPRTERQRRKRRRGVWGASPENFEKLDAISCNLAYIFAIRMASGIIQNWAFAEQKTAAATFRNSPISDKKTTDLSCRPMGSHRHTHTRIHPHTSSNSSDFGHYKIKIQFQKYFFRHCIGYNVKNKIDFTKNRGPRPPGSAHDSNSIRPIN